MQSTKPCSELTEFGSTLMSKFARLNKTNHYQDSGSSYRRISSSPSSLQLFDTSDRTFWGLKSTRRIMAIKSNCKTRTLESSKDRIAFIHRLSSSNVSLSKLAFLTTNVLIILLIFHSSSSSNQVYSLNCYHCSSVDNPGCDESFVGRANITDTDCEKHIGKPAKVCRKIIQYIEHKKVVIRACGWIDDRDEKDRKSMCYKRSGTFAIMMESCNCYTDNCNHSANLVPNKNVLILSTCILILLMSIIGIKSNNLLARRWS